MTSLLGRLKSEGSVLLEPYGHQVGGHHLLLKYGKECICKPMGERERAFYEILTPDLRQFTAGYHGLITVLFELLPSEGVKVLALPHRPPTHSNGGGTFTCSTHKSILGDGQSSITSKALSGDGYVNPWSQEFGKIVREKLLQQTNDSNTYTTEYVVLDNLTSRFSSPSVLDLKLGTRQYSDVATEEKVRKHTLTCANSTSATLGVRMCGMQKYDAAQQEYMFRDKYYGRSLSEGGFRDELRSFLHNGVRLRTELLGPIIDMLEQLSLIIQSQHSYRFFSSSLLIIYDGAEESGRGSSDTPPASLSDMRRMVDIRMIDFASCTPPSKDSQYLGPDTGYLLGLSTILDTFSTLQRNA